MSFTGFQQQPPLLPLNGRERTAITNNFLTVPCVRCGDANHSCLDCHNDALDNSQGYYRRLSPGKKRSANMLIRELKEKYANNDPMFKKTIEKKEEKERQQAIADKEARERQQAIADKEEKDRHQALKAQSQGQSQEAEQRVNEENDKQKTSISSGRNPA